MERGRRFQNILLDVDGVLLDTMPIWENSANLYLKEVWGIEAYRELDRECATMSLLEAGAYIRERYPQITASEGELASGVAAFIRERYQRAPAKNGMEETVWQLYRSGYRLYLATASDLENVRGAMSNLGVWECFEGIYTCTEIGYSKNDTEYFDGVAKRIGVPCSGLLMVEDSLHSMRTAKRAGLTVAGVYEASAAENEDEIRKVCDVYLETLPLLRDWLKKTEME